jgi:phosphopentomutase
MKNQTREKRAIIIVLDSVGIGALPDAAEFGDAGVNTLGHIAERVGGLELPNLQRLGLGNIGQFEGVAPVPSPEGSFGRMLEASRGKDTIIGHWEMMGVITEKALPVFPEGFPPEMVRQFLEASGCRDILGNKAASGTAIIEELGELHVKTGHPIVYTSADSVFQIAAHEEIIPVDQLYTICEAARGVCDDFMVGRVIARPFVGKEGAFQRTPRRKDFPLKPPHATALDILKENGLPVMGIGKIEDIFAGQGITRAVHTKSNSDGMRVLLEELSITKSGLIFANLVDFDMKFGHRRDPKGYAGALELFDKELGVLLERLTDSDLLILCADHGCDPTHVGSDHTREAVPLLVYSKGMEAKDLGTRRTFSDIGATVLKLFQLPHQLPGSPVID